MKLVLLLFIAICAISRTHTKRNLLGGNSRDNSQNDDGRIIGGQAVNIADVGWQVSIQEDGYHFCGGSILSDRWIITAGICFARDIVLSRISVRAGSSKLTSGGTLKRLEAFFVHPQYNSQTQDNDAAVVRLSSPLSINSGSIRPIKLVNSGVELRGGTRVTVSGWGRLTESPSELSPTLQGALITVIDNPTCQRYYVADYVITDNMMCAGFIEGGKGPCQGDTGGPLVEGNKTLVGIISWALGCARPASPGVYTRLASTSVRNFIRSVTGL